MFGGGAHHFRGDSTQASSVVNMQTQQHGLLTSTQPAITKDGVLSFNKEGVANESSFFYNSDEDDREVEEILQQSNRLMERRNDRALSQQEQQEEEERRKELQRQKLELLSLQHANGESTI